MTEEVRFGIGRRTAILTFVGFCFLLLLTTPVFAVDAMSTKLTRVESVKVCMVNNTLFAKDQIPVQVAGKTYFGCCEMCKSRLKNDPESRQAIDPVSKKPVDKASAVIGANANGQVFYFESEDNLAKFSK